MFEKNNAAQIASHDVLHGKCMETPCAIQNARGSQGRDWAANPRYHQTTYLGVRLWDDPRWTCHVNDVVSKANDLVEFLKHNSHSCSERPKRSVCFHCDTKI